MKTVLITGERLRRLANLPTSMQLFERFDPPNNWPSRAIKAHFKAKEEFLRLDKSKTVKQNFLDEWLSSLYVNTHKLSWEELSWVLAAGSAKVGNGGKAHYNHGICDSVNNIKLRRLIHTLLASYDFTGIITDSWDILLEQSLKSDYSDPLASTLFFYGGFPMPQAVRKLTDLIKREALLVPLSGKIELCKLRGSINWARENDLVKIHQDVRAAFWKTKKSGSVLLVPHLEEKLRSPWNTSIWDAASYLLTNADKFVIIDEFPPEKMSAYGNLIFGCIKESKVLKSIDVITASNSTHQEWKYSVPNSISVDKVKLKSDGSLDVGIKLSAADISKISSTIMAGRRIGRKFFTWGPVGPKSPTAFISYCWEDDAHIDWVERVASLLQSKGITVHLDRWDLSPGDYLAEFMEKIGKVDYVLPICTPDYKHKWDNRLGGVGEEAHLITALRAAHGDGKIVPIHVYDKAKDWELVAPIWLKGMLAIRIKGYPKVDSLKSYFKMVRKKFGKLKP